jgi:hypothetical protein
MAMSYRPSPWPIDPERLPWWTGLDPQAPGQWRSGRLAHVRTWFLASSVLWIGFMIGLVFVQQEPSTLAPWLVWPIVAITLGLARVRIPAWLVALYVLGAALLVGVAVYASSHANSAHGWTAAIFVVLAVFQIGVPLLAREYAASANADRAVPVPARQQQVFGRTGTALATVRGWRQEAVESGLLGEALTGELLEHYVTRIPSARIFHSLRWPGSATADVDHVVLCGKRLVLIDTKRWPPGEYTFAADGGLLRAGRPFLGSDIRLANAVAGYQRLLPRCDVHGVVLIHPNRPGAVTVPEGGWTRTRVLTAHGFLTQTCAWLAEESVLIDTRAVALLWSMTNDPDSVGGPSRRWAGK